MCNEVLILKCYIVFKDGFLFFKVMGFVFLLNWNGLFDYGVLM